MRYKILLALFLIVNLAMCQSKQVADEIIMMNLKTLNLAIFEHNTVRFKVVDNEYHRFEYDSNGNPTIVYAQNGSSKQVFSYDQIGRLIKQAYNGTNIYYTYDNEGRFEKMFVDDSSVAFEQYKYNSRNQLIERKQKNKSGALVTYQSYDFDTEGRLLTYKLYNTDSQTIYQSDSLEYDENSKLVRRIDKHYQKEGLWFTSVINSSYDLSGNKTEDKVWHNDELVISETYSYDSYNRMIKKVKFDTSRQIRETYIFSYENNKLFRIRNLSHDLKDNKEVLTNDSYIDYEYDAFGNQVATIYRDSRLVGENRSTLKYIEIKR